MFLNQVLVTIPKLASNSFMQSINEFTLGQRDQAFVFITTNLSILPVLFSAYVNVMSCGPGETSLESMLEMEGAIRPTCAICPWHSDQGQKKSVMSPQPAQPRDSEYSVWPGLHP